MIKTHFNKILLIALFIAASCSTEEQKAQPSKQTLAKHLEFSQYTDPGKFVYLYDDLPESIEEICDLIKNQLVHPFDLKKFGDKIPKDRVYEDRSIPSVSQMLEELVARNRKGLVSSRQPEDRLVVACVHHSMLLASILRHRGIPVRIRAGFAKYIGDDRRIRVSHVICEVWDAQRNVWFLVDPDRQKIEFDRHEFEFAFETWERLRKGNIRKMYYVSRYKSVAQATVHLLCHDLSYVIGTEELYWNDPPIVKKIDKRLNDLPKTDLQLLNKIAALLRSPDSHLDELVKIQTNNSSLKYGEE